MTLALVVLALLIFGPPLLIVAMRRLKPSQVAEVLRWNDPDPKWHGRHWRRES